MMVSPAFPYAGNLTGSPAHILKLTSGLRHRGVAVSILQIDSREPADEAARRYSATLGAMAWRLPGLLRRIRPDVLHCHGHKAAVFLLPFARAMRVPLICEL